MQEKDISSLVNDENFLNYCFKRNDDDIRYWEKWLSENPIQRKQVEELRKILILLAEESRQKTMQGNFAELKGRMLKSKQRPISKRYPIWKISTIAAAAILLIASTVTLLYFNKNETDKIASVQDVGPGGHKATLILTDGKRVNLTDAADGAIANQGGIQIKKTKSGQIVYEVLDVGGVASLGYNTIETPLGGEYQVNLPDGTQVWLNSQSSLRYPIHFAGKERRVELQGEGYFEVAHNKAMPFKVKSIGQTIEVLGTHFNISAYADDKITKTSLLEGSVKIIRNTQSQLLLPGQQAQVTTNDLDIVDNADFEDVMAWKNGYFKFNESLESIMNKIERWYGVQVIYQIKPTPEKTYSGKISRKRNISAILKIIEYDNDIRFKIEGTKVYVTEK